MISTDEQRGLFWLDTPSTSYVLQIYETGHLILLYWGKRLPHEDIRYLYPCYGGAFCPNLFDAPNGYVCPDTLPLEYPTFGLGDYHEPAFYARNPAGDRLCDLRYAGCRLTDGVQTVPGMPHVRAAQAPAQTLELTLRDPRIGVTVRLYYTVFADSDVIARCAAVRYDGGETLVLHQAASAHLELPDGRFEAIRLPGAQCREREIERTPLGAGRLILDSRRGTSSHQMNPFLALVRPETGEETGDVYGFSLLYSGNFRICAEQDQFHMTRVQIGINPFDFAWRLRSGEEFWTPQAVMVYSGEGLGGMSREFHRLCRRRISPPAFARTHRPVVINNWEATYFDFDEEKLAALADACRELPLDLFVLDDGWFGHRDAGNSSLGDWTVHARKLPHGLEPVIRAFAENGLAFGLWVEPEMISPDSELYRRHPDWCLHVAGRESSLARSQLVLDLTREDVRAYLLETLTGLLKAYPIRYLKWDMNRPLSNVGSSAWPAEEQASLSHRYVLGLYSLLQTLTARFPHLFIEGCSGGGGRFDFGMLYYVPQIWTSDNSDAMSRLKIQYGTSLVYPPSTMAAHVSAVPNHQTGRITDFTVRGDVAACCCFGYELDPRALIPEEREAVCAQVERSRRIEPLVLEGDFYRLRSPFAGNDCSWMLVSPDKTRAVVLYAHVLSRVSEPADRLCLRGLDPEKRYRILPGGQVLSGAVLMAAGLIRPRFHGDFQTCFYELQEELANGESQF